MERGKKRIAAVELTKKYGSHAVLEHINLVFEEGGIYAVTGYSGCGKTTLLHILMGILEADEGSVQKEEGTKFSAVFQENRLFEFLTAAENAAAVQKPPGSLEEINRILGEILPRDSLNQRVEEFSGGMKRRAAIGRAMLARADILIMDEPLTGLDEDTKEQVIRFILKYRGFRTLIFTTHQEEEIGLFGAEKITLVPNRK